jgi:hypothetical protein
VGVLAERSRASEGEQGIGTVSQVFVNYRRQDAAGFASRIHADLARRLGSDTVFRDVGIEPGVPYVQHITQLLGSCRVLVAVIGPEWASVTDRHGRRRLDDPDDLVCLEIEAGLKRPDVEVIPVLVEGARMPERDQLPDSLIELRGRNAHEMSDRRWDYDLEVLAARLERVLGRRVRPPDPGHRLARALIVTAVAALAALPAGALADPAHDRRISLGEQGLVDPERVTSYALERGLFWGAVGGITLACAALVARSQRSPIVAALLGFTAGALGGAAGGAAFQWLRVYRDVDVAFVMNASTWALAGALLGLVFAGVRPGASRFEAALGGVAGALVIAGLNHVFRPASSGTAHNVLLIGQAALVMGLIAAVVFASRAASSAVRTGPVNVGRPRSPAT